MKTSFYSFMCLISLFIFASCHNKLMSFQEDYSTPHQFISSSSKDQVWDQLIDLLMAKGIALMTLDKNSGVITSDKTSFLNSYTWERKKGGLLNPNAMVVCSQLRIFGIPLKPEIVSGQWAFRIKEQADKTIVIISLVNATGKIVVENTSSPHTTRETNNLVVKSTGLFEKTIEDALK